MPQLATIIEDGDLEAFMSLVEEDRSIIRKTLADDAPEQPLHYAIWQNQTEIALFLIEQGADVNAGGELGRTPLHYAAIHGRVDLAKILLEKGANPNSKDQGNLTPLFFAAPSGVEGAKEIARHLVTIGAEADLDSLVSLGETQKVCNLLAEDKSNLSRAIEPSSLLSHAVLMIDHEVTLKNPYGPSPEQDTTVEEYLPMLSCLLEAGADINAIGNYGSPPLYLAVQSMNIPTLVRFLLENGADVNYEYRDGDRVIDIISLSSKASSQQQVHQILEEYKNRANA
ncbi:MAG: ankyrin repeat domain-containing protein [Proteobacteria bacterium]|nr:MAG: ankyrin repeat domain-containing protein [Pseudomonadota bacterium]